MKKTVLYCITLSALLAGYKLSLNPEVNKKLLFASMWIDRKESDFRAYPPGDTVINVQQHIEQATDGDN